MVQLYGMLHLDRHLDRDRQTAQERETEMMVEWHRTICGQYAVEPLRLRRSPVSVGNNDRRPRNRIYFFGHRRIFIVHLKEVRLNDYLLWPCMQTKSWL